MGNKKRNAVSPLLRYLKRRLLGRIIVWIWGRPGGIVVAILGLLIGWSAFSKPDTKKAG